MPRIAVVAVHGVADQQPGETNRAIANLLANVDEPGRGAAYDALLTSTVRIPVRTLPVPDREVHAQYAFDDLADAITAGRLSTAPVPAPAVDLAFTSSLLANYETDGPDETYETTVIATRRQASGHAEARDVDIYEMYWADLSRLTESWWRMFAEVYQLLFIWRASVCMR